MTNLHQRHCLNHATREAVARCPECGHFYCHECIAEHEDRVICAACLRKMLRQTEKKRRPLFAWLAGATAFCFSLMIGWLAFYLAGKILLSIPTSFHDGTLWQNSFWQE
jgi:uncharacterized paraquat-inducible protein A